MEEISETTVSETICRKLVKLSETIWRKLMKLSETGEATVRGTKRAKLCKTM